jgi:hypothetical protein
MRLRRRAACKRGRPSYTFASGPGRGSDDGGSDDCCRLLRDPRVGIERSDIRGCPVVAARPLPGWHGQAGSVWSHIGHDGAGLCIIHAGPGPQSSPAAGRESGLPRSAPGNSASSRRPTEPVSRPSRTSTGWSATEGNFGGQAGLTKNWAVQIVRQVGNDGEVFERRVGTETRLVVPRTLDHPLGHRRYLYAPPIRRERLEPVRQRSIQFGPPPIAAACGEGQG